MNIDDLSWQARHHGGVSPRMVRTLLGLGQLELLIQAAQERGDWNCAQAAARELCAAAEFERALALLVPFTDVGWRAAEWTTAEIMIRRGEGEEALAMVRPDAAERGDGHACARYAELAVMAGRCDEAIGVLTPHLGESWLLSHLIKVTEGQGRDDEVLDLLARAAERAEGESTGRLDGWQVLLVTAQVLERAGRADEAVDVLRTEMASGRRHPLNFPEYYANLLARQGLIEESGSLAAGEHYAAFDVYAKALEDVGRVPEAEALLRERIGAHDHPKDRVALIHLLVRQGRMTRPSRPAGPRMATTTAGTCSTGRWNCSSTTAAHAEPSNSWKSSPAHSPRDTRMRPAPEALAARRSGPLPGGHRSGHRPQRAGARRMGHRVGATAGAGRPTGSGPGACTHPPTNWPTSTWPTC
ncbi:tetratricopeptide repeat protein [Streptomyces sp. NPDC048448]|uniref:tetratricopeptide repeat protein n=1 Tax=Streptomyces sp. NPDC048448 TaxID=3365554 RepID=UPI00371C35CE